MFAKKHLPTILKNLPTFKSKNYKQALIDSFLAIDQRLESPEGRAELAAAAKVAQGTATPSPTSALEQGDPMTLANYVGCTACVSLITKTEIYVANAGDSRCVLCKGGIALNMSEDHKPNSTGERARIERAEGYVEDNRVNGVINLSRSLGDLDYKLNKKLKQEEQMITAFPDVRAEKLANDTDFLLIACDGIWDCMTSQQAVDFVKEHLVQAKTEKNPKYSNILGELFEKIIAVDVDSSGKLSLTTSNHL